MDASELSGDGKLKESIALLQNAIKIEPNYFDAYVSMAGMYSELKNYDAAIASYEKGRAVDSIYFREFNLPYSISLAGTDRLPPLARVFRTEGDHS